MNLVLFVLFLLSSPEVVYASPEICTYLPKEDWIACQAPKTWNDFCFSVTNYWPFDMNGNLVAGNGQTDSDPTGTATGAYIHSTEQAGEWVAGPFPMISHGYRSYACISGYDCLPIWDTFGHPVYQSGGFWHSRWKTRVIGIDIFTNEPTYFLDCNGEILIYNDGQRVE